MSFQESKSRLDEISLHHKFFEAVKNANIKEVNRFFSDEDIKPWEFLEEDGYTGNSK